MKAAGAVERGEAINAAMRDALAIIKAEHRALAVVINALDSLVAQIRDKTINPDFKLLWSMLYYIEAFPEKLHHPKEDCCLFARIRLRTHEGDELLDELERQHRVGEERIRNLQLALGHFVAGKRGGFATFAMAAERFAAMAREHMALEERDAFTLAEKHLLPADWKATRKAFQQNTDPLTGIASGANQEFGRLFAEILSLASAALRHGSSSR
jgi:hemerythrin-like domain-containing protein